MECKHIQLIEITCVGSDMSLQIERVIKSLLAPRTWIPSNRTVTLQMSCQHSLKSKFLPAVHALIRSLIIRRSSHGRHGPRHSQGSRWQRCWCQRSSWQRKRSRSSGNIELRHYRSWGTWDLVLLVVANSQQCWSSNSNWGGSLFFANWFQTSWGRLVRWDLMVQTRSENSACSGCQVSIGKIWHHILEQCCCGHPVGNRRSEIGWRCSDQWL